ncbi:MAG: ABC transporter ATP-binding protein [Capsulimonadales bacterium]|nr:ABC transporter ATP-binding protein [Capsulimonadales bacterium]
MNGLPILDLKSVRKVYRGTDGAPDTPVLENVDLRLAPGESVAIVGPSGAGKSTLLNIIGTLDRPDSGTVLLDGKDVTALNDEGLAQVRAREIGFIFQLHHLLPQCTVLENVLIPTLAGEPDNRREKATDRARRLLERVGLSGRIGHRPGQLSGGERQRVAVVRALINEPRLLLADEPTGALDVSNANHLADLLIELNREEGVALLTITHAREIAARMAKVYELRDGRLRSMESGP